MRWTPKGRCRYILFSLQSHKNVVDKRFAYSRVRFLMFSILHGKKGFWDIRKNGWFFKTPGDQKKNDKFGTKYLKTQVNMVISKIMFPHPQLELNFETHKNVGDNFYFVYKYIYTSSKYPQSSEKFKGHFWYPVQPVPPVPPVPSNSRFALARPSASS